MHLSIPHRDWKSPSLIIWFSFFAKSSNPKIDIQSTFTHTSRRAYMICSLRVSLFTQLLSLLALRISIDWSLQFSTQHNPIKLSSFSPIVQIGLFLVKDVFSWWSWLSHDQTIAIFKAVIQRRRNRQLSAI
jgi:hypothetical protein